MNVSDLLETHTVMSAIDGLDVNNYLYTTTDIDSYIPEEYDASSETDLVIFQQFTFSHEIITTGILCGLRFDFSSNCTLDGGSSDNVTWVYLHAHGTQTSGKVSVYLTVVHGDKTVTGSTIDLDLNTQYAIQIGFSRTDGTDGGEDALFIGRVYLLSVDTESGESTSLDYVTPGVYGGSYNTMYQLRSIATTKMPLSTLYEPCAKLGGMYANSLLIPPRVFGFGTRRLDYTYATELSTWKYYLFPPKPIFDGSAYDHSEILEDQILELNDTVDDLTNDLATANAKIVTLEDELSEGGTVFDSIKDLFDTLTAMYDTSEGEVKGSFAVQLIKTLISYVTTQGVTLGAPA